MTILMVIIAIGIVSYDTAIAKTDITHGKSDMAEIAKAVLVAQYKSGLSLRDMMHNATGGADGCYTTQGCYKSYRTQNGLSLDLRNIPNTDPCYTQWATALQAIKNNTGGQLSYDTNALQRDPWGSPYILRINDGCTTYITDRNQCSAPTYTCLPGLPYQACCQNDGLISVGPDGLEGTADDFSFGTTPLPHISVGFDGVANNADDDLGGLIPRAYTGKCAFNQDASHGGAAYCDGD